MGAGRPTRSPRPPRRRVLPWAVAALAVGLGLACVVPALDEGGKECTDSCPLSGLPCIDGRCGGASGAGPCLQLDGGQRPGPDMVWIPVDGGGFCIDSTEVTNAQFNDYVVAGTPLVPPLPVACMGSVAAPPERVQTAELANLPVSGQTLTFCYAWSYCHWAGKRLCGQLGDGGTVSTAADPHTLEWYYACANGAQDTIYPYGNDFVSGDCNVGSGSVADAGSDPACNGVGGGFAQVLDLGGNVAEYVNNVDSIGNLAAQGASYDPTYNQNGMGSCNFAVGFNGTLQGVGAVGFRCCADN
jgi:formylglycine-generating enzyme